MAEIVRFRASTFVDPSEGADAAAASDPVRGCGASPSCRNRARSRSGAELAKSASYASSSAVWGMLVVDEGEELIELVDVIVDDDYFDAIENDPDN